MKATILTGLLTIATTLTGLVAGSAPASAFAWDYSWDASSQPTIKKGFDHTPFQKFVQQEGLELPGASQFKLNPALLKLKYDHEVSAYFINEGAGFRNQLAFSSTGATNTSGLLFHDVSCSGPDCIGGWGGDALALGDGVSLGLIKGGSQLDFGIRANGYWGGSNIFGTQKSMNEDGLQHVVAYAVNNRYLLLGFEDLYGGLYKTGLDRQTGKWNEHSDRDFNDVILVVDVGEANLTALMNSSQTTPEPSVAFGLLGLAAAGWLKRKQPQAEG